MMIGAGPALWEVLASTGGAVATLSGALAAWIQGMRKKKGVEISVKFGDRIISVKSTSTDPTDVETLRQALLNAVRNAPAEQGEQDSVQGILNSLEEAQENQPKPES
ncbi:hypothetical protein [Streptomyces sp. NPDC056683]|uniref:effector-associated constant component EACC1 n=1 Tax=Streptomyces sp. NPDC056683 TaxID=3345910 RepID=UPI0036A37D87